MFADAVNASFNNELFGPPTIAAMHESAVRLYEAARVLADTEGQSAVAALLNESPQTLNNWETRGVSKQGAMKAQAAWGCDANWIRTGQGKMSVPALLTWPFSTELHANVMNLEPEDMAHLEAAIWAYLRKSMPAELNYEHEMDKPHTIVSPSGGVRPGRKTG